MLVRHGLNRLDGLDRATPAPIRRMEMSRPGEPVHLDVKKLGRTPRDGGWRAHRRVVVRGQHDRMNVGYAFVRSVVEARAGGTASPRARLGRAPSSARRWAS